MSSEEKVLEALHLLQDVCKENNRNCSKCMLRNMDGHCGIFCDSYDEYFDTPQDWELKDYDDPRLILN